MQLIVDELMTEYFRTGKGTPVLLLHGWGDDSRSWHEFAAKLGKHHDVIVPDLPGFGGTEAPKTAWSLTDYAEFVRAFVQKLEVKPVAIIGHSNGGAIAVRAVGRGMLAAGTLILLASAGVRGTKTKKALYITAKVGKAIAAPFPKRVKSRLRSRLYQQAGSDLLVAEHLQETFKRIVRDDVREDAAFISAPTMLVYGGKDTETPVELGRELEHAIEGSKLVVLNDKGHMLHLEALDEIATLAEDFIRA